MTPNKWTLGRAVDPDDRFGGLECTFESKSALTNECMQWVVLLGREFTSGRFQEKRRARSQARCEVGKNSVQVVSRILREPGVEIDGVEGVRLEREKTKITRLRIKRIGLNRTSLHLTAQVGRWQIEEERSIPGGEFGGEILVRRAAFHMDLNSSRS